MQHPNPGPIIAQPRLRPHRAPSRLPPNGGGGLPPDIILRVPALLDTAAGRIARQQIEHHVDCLIQLLDALEAPMQDMEEDNEDHCPAGDDDLSSSPMGWKDIGEPEDGEASLGWTAEGDNGDNATRLDCDREQDDADDEDGDPSGGDEDDIPGDLRGVPATAFLDRSPCSPGPFQLVGREWGDVRSGV